MKSPHDGAATNPRRELLSLWYLGAAGLYPFAVIEMIYPTIPGTLYLSLYHTSFFSEYNRPFLCQVYVSLGIKHLEVLIFISTPW